MSMYGHGSILTWPFTTAAMVRADLPICTWHNIPASEAQKLALASPFSNCPTMPASDSPRLRQPRSLWDEVTMEQ
ncbi:hypothetical protein C8Q70DRAFT_1034498 [Cubamyces menziesii]|nr:hypothetical protein C8Q70DRAFT_1034498 [Cubamyces menziesii]